MALRQNRSNIALGVILLMIGLLALAILLRLQRGLLGLILTGILIILGIYWFKEIKKVFEGAKASKEYPLEVSEYDDVISLTAQVPGPENEVSFEILGNKILLRGGMGFRRAVKLPYKVKVLSSSYINGILHLRLIKADLIEEKRRRNY